MWPQRLFLRWARIGLHRHFFPVATPRRIRKSREGLSLPVFGVTGLGSGKFPTKLVRPLGDGEMSEPATVPRASPIAAEREKLLGLRAVLIVVALIELVDALSDLPNLFDGVHNLFGEASGSGVAEAITTTHLVCHPLLATAVVVLTATGRVRYAIIALGVIVIATWLNHLPWLERLDLSKGRDVQWAAKQIIAFPLMAAFAITLAARDARPGLATALVSVPTVNNLFGLASYAVGLIINGI